MKCITIKRYEEFKFVMNNGAKTFKQYGIVFKMPKEQFVKEFANYAKITGNLYGIMTSKKLGNAVARNYIKRKIRIIVKRENLAEDVWIVLGKRQMNAKKNKQKLDI